MSLSGIPRPSLAADEAEGPRPHLGPRDRQILRLRLLDELTHPEIAGCLGVTRREVSRVVGRVLSDLRSELGDDTAVSTSMSVGA